MDYTEVFLKQARKFPQYQEAVDIVSRNADGDAWLIGGFIFRTLVSAVYNMPLPVKVDLDFIVNPAAREFSLPAGWQATVNRFGNPKFVKRDRSIDYVPLEEVYSIRVRQLPPTIENFFSGVPLKIQGMAFDLNTQRLVGDMGMRAVGSVLVEVNDLEFTRYAAAMKGVTTRQYIKQKADDIGFFPVFPPGV